MQKCPNCGNKLSNIDVLCPKCGALVEVVKVNSNRSVHSSSAVLDNQHKENQFDEQYNGQDTHADNNNYGKRIEKPFGFDDFSLNHPIVPKGQTQASLDGDPGENQKDLSDGRSDPEDNYLNSNDMVKESNHKIGKDHESFSKQFDSDFSSIEQPNNAPKKNLSDMVLVPDPMEDSTRSKRYVEPTPNQSHTEFDDDVMDDFDPEEFMRQYRENKEKGLYNSEEQALSNDEVTKQDSDNLRQYRHNSGNDDGQRMQQESTDEIRIPKHIADNPRQYRHRRNNDNHHRMQQEPTDEFKIPKQDADTPRRYRHNSGNADGHRMQQKPTDEIALSKRSAQKRWLEIEEVTDTTILSRETRRYSPVDETNLQGNQVGTVEKSYEDSLASTKSKRYPESLEDTQTQDTSDGAQTRSSAREKHEKSSLHKPAKSLNRNISPVFTVLIWVVIAAALFFGFMHFDSNIRSAYGTYGNFINEVTNGKLIIDPDEQANLHNVYVSETQSKTANGDSAHRYKVTSKDGVRVNIVALDQSYDLKNGRVDLLISDYELAKALNLHADDQSITTDKASFVVETNETTYTYTIDEVELFLNDATYSRLKPDSSKHKAQENFFYLEIRVDPDAHVYINDVDYTDDINEAGVLATQIPVDTVGESIYDLHITQLGKAAVTDTISITREKRYATLVPTEEYFRIYSDTFTVDGITEIGSNVTATINDKTYSGIVDPGGLYAVVCNVSNYGLHYVDIATSNAAYIDTAKTIKVELLPEPSAFTAQANSLSIGEIVGSTDTLQNIPIRVSGLITALSSDEDAKNFLLTDDNRNMSCHYFGVTQLEENMVITLYGMFDVGKNAFYVMFAA